MDAYSALTLNLVESTITGKINEANTAAKIAINLDEDSSIILTGNSYYTSMVNEKIDGANLVNETYKWTSSTEKEIKTSSSTKETEIIIIIKPQEENLQMVKMELLMVNHQVPNLKE